MPEHDSETPTLRDVVQRWPVLDSTDLHRDGWVVALRADTLSADPGHDPAGDPGGEGEATMRRLVLEHPGAVVVLALDGDDRVLCLWQYRHPAGRRFVELPAGLCDGGPDEEPLDVAVRELREEAQLQAASWTFLVSSYPSPGISAEVHHLFVARDLSASDRGDFALEHEEADMTSAWVAFDDLHAAVVGGDLGDSPLALCVLLARARGLV